MFLTALILGFTGSLHCLGMCSPLAMTVTGQSSRGLVKRIVYNLGRILTYSIAGSIVAAIGFALIFFKIQNILTIGLGIILLIAGLSGVTQLKIPFVTSAIARFSSRLRMYFSVFIQRKSYGAVFLLGSLNGLLPCGLSFIALSFCLSFDNPVDGFYFMMLFGAGTLPVLLGATSIFHWLVNRLHVSFAKISTAMLIVSGVLLIGRVFADHTIHSPESPASVVDIVLCK
jgi:sulfite exporter TauE/SafE